jgi:hypothetical protein
MHPLHGSLRRERDVGLRGSGAATKGVTMTGKQDNKADRKGYRDNANKGKGNHQPGQTYGGGGGVLREGASDTGPDPHLEGRTKGKGSAHQSGAKPPKTPG